MADVIPNVPEPAAPLPQPVFHDPQHHIKIYQGDCLEILAAIPADCVDLIFADPPYFLSNDGITCHAGKMVSVNKGAWDKSQGPDLDHAFNRAWLAANSPGELTMCPLHRPPKARGQEIPDLVASCRFSLVSVAFWVGGLVQ
jgi:tRNA1(Val) A37 N6-methylase TrmN6